MPSHGWWVTRFGPSSKSASRSITFLASSYPSSPRSGSSAPLYKGYDCTRLNAICYGLICQELERGDSGIRSFVSVQSSLCMYPIYTYGSDEQKRQYLPRMARGELIGCFGLTEPQGGSDPASMKTHAKRRGKDWVLNGSKMWITNGAIADLALVWAVTEEGIRGFIIEKGTPGFGAPEIERKFSLRASVTSALYFDDVLVPEENVLPNVVGLRGPLSCLAQARYGIAWGVIGAAQACFAQALEYSKSRILFNRPLAQNQAIQIRLADMARRINAAQLLALQLGRLKDQGTMQPAQVSLAKWNNCRMALDIARLPRHAGRRRHQRRIRPHPPYAESGKRHHLRGHRDHPPARPWARADGVQHILIGAPAGAESPVPESATGLPGTTGEGHRHAADRAAWRRDHQQFTANPFRYRRSSLRGICRLIPLGELPVEGCA